MGKRRRILLAIVLVAIGCGLAWLISHPREPQYQGKPLSVWLSGYSMKGTLPYILDARKQADEAVRSVGTNAIPLLLGMIRTRDSSLKTRVIDLLNKTRVVRIDSPTAESRTYPAAMGFRALGREAGSAVPALVRAYQDNYSFASQRDCLYALGGIGPAVSNAVPMIEGIAFETNNVLRYQAIGVLGDVHVRLDLTVPALIRLLGDSDKEVRRGAIQSLGNLEPDAKASVPVLIQGLNDPDRVAVRWSQIALRKIDPEIAAKVVTNYPTVR